MRLRSSAGGPTALAQRQVFGEFHQRAGVLGGVDHRGDDAGSAAIEQAGGAGIVADGDADQGRHAI
jgi:hypothetical protein